MTWQAGLFFDPEDPRELEEDPFRCVWCRKPLDASRVHEAAAPEAQIIEAVLRMRGAGRTLQDVLHYVRLAWEHEAQG
jgi:hypothetical protein